MHFEGRHAYQATPDILWTLLNDSDVIARITPGIKQLDPVGDDKFDALVEVKLGPVSGRFKGSLEIADKVEPERYTLRVKQNSPIGNVAGDFVIALEEGDGETAVSFTGDARLTGVIASIGQRVLSGVARNHTDKFFKALGEEVAQATGADPAGTPP